MVIRPRNGISLCSGGGGLELGLQLAEPDFHCRCFVEWEAEAQAALVAGMLGDDLPGSSRHGASPEGMGLGHARERLAKVFKEAAVWPDVRTFIGDGWRGHIDLISAGYPCQPFSAAGQRAGSDDERRLWPDVARILWETGAEWGFFENVAGHISLGLETVLRDLWDMGWTPAAGLFSSQETGNAHERQRVFIVAHRQRVDRGGEHEQRGARSGRAGPTGSGRELADAQRDLRCADSREPDAGPDWGDHPRGTSGDMADANGGNARAERQQRSGEQRLQPSGGANGGGALGSTNTNNDPRGLVDRGVKISSGGSESKNLGEGEELHRERVRVESGGTGDGMAARPHIHPPGPDNTGAWGHIITMAPDLAPSLAIRDLVSRAQDLAAMVAEGRVAEAQAQSDLCRMADAMAQRPRALRLYGNGVDPLVAGYAWRTLSAAHGLRPLDLEAAR